TLLLTDYIPGLGNFAFFLGQLHLGADVADVYLLAQIAALLLGFLLPDGDFLIGRLLVLLDDFRRSEGFLFLLDNRFAVQLLCLIEVNFPCRLLLFSNGFVDGFLLVGDGFFDSFIVIVVNDGFRNRFLLLGSLNRRVGLAEHLQIQPVGDVCGLVEGNRRAEINGRRFLLGFCATDDHLSRIFIGFLDYGGFPKSG